MNALNTPSVETDAQVRAFRTFVQGVGVDVLAAIAVALTAAIAGGIEWTSAYWLALSLAVAKSAVVAIVSYLARKFVPPVNAPTSGGGVA